MKIPHALERVVTLDLHETHLEGPAELVEGVLQPVGDREQTRPFDGLPNDPAALRFGSLIGAGLDDAVFNGRPSCRWFGRLGENRRRKDYGSQEREPE